jgi:hypothetical protein
VSFEENKKRSVKDRFERGKEEGKLREGDARRRSGYRNVRIGQVDISGRG